MAPNSGGESYTHILVFRVENRGFRGFGLRRDHSLSSKGPQKGCATLSPTARLLAGLVVIVAVADFTGCQRAWYRKTADQDVYHIISDKAADPRWSLDRIEITPDPSSRNYDPSDPDCPPLPPDDETASLAMDSPNGFRGARIWGELDQIEFIENPAWRFYLSTDPDGEPEIQDLSLPQAVELSLVHSREYQNQLENLYRAALALTFERYRLTTRPLGFEGEPGAGLFYQSQPNDQSFFELGESPRFGAAHIGISRLFPSGAQLAVELANQTLWFFSGGDSTASASSLAFSLVQPLLRGGTREIALERLTQSERDVLYAVRDFARFRKQFFVSTITGGQVAGLQRFLGGFGFLPGGSAAPRVGFYPLLLDLQQLRNRQYIVRTLEYLIADLRAAGATDLDIARLESTLADTLGDLYRDERVYADRLDQYKVQLGLPPDMNISMDDSLLKPFEFADPLLVETEENLREFSGEIRRLRNENGTVDANVMDRLNELLAATRRSSELVSADFSKLDTVLPEALESLTAKDAAQLESIVDQERERLANSIEELVAIEGLVGGMAISDDLESAEERRASLLLVLRKLSVIQIIVRVQLIPIQPFDIGMEEVSQLAIVNRLDLMNQRARVVDSRRRLEIAADQLESRLDLVVEGSLNTRTTGDGNNNPFDFRADESEYRAGIEFDTPLDQIAERNVFRAAQIGYQQARRSYVGIEDNVKLDVRQFVRTLEAQANEIAQRQRRIQYTARELELAETQADATQRGLSLNNALRNLNRAQDELIEAWLDYETTRLNLYRDTGLMRINDRGFWADSYYQTLFDEPDQERRSP